MISLADHKSTMRNGGEVLRPAHPTLLLFLVGTVSSIVDDMGSVVAESKSKVPTLLLLLAPSRHTATRMD